LPAQRSVELELVLVCARAALEDSGAAAIRQALGGKVDWERVVSLCLRHGLLPLVRRPLSTFPELVPAAAQVALARAHVAITARGASLTQELGRLLRLLEGGGVEALAYKGPALAVQLYGDVQARAFLDLDLLVRPRDFGRCRSLLLESGYAPMHDGAKRTPTAVSRRSECDESFVHAGKGILVELHWAATPPYFSFPLSTEALFERRVRVEVPELSALAPCPEDLLLLLAVNGTKDTWARLETIVALAALVRRHPQLAWTAALDRAAELNARRMVHVGLLLARHLLGAIVPDAVMRGVDRDPAAAALAEHAILRLDREDGGGPIGFLPRSLFILRSRERLNDRLRFCALRALTPTRLDAAALPLPDPLWPVYYLVRPWRLLRRRRPT
jgi:Uncharacterised nucleotidyltransferase